jgi:hypothetical protein
LDLRFGFAVFIAWIATDVSTSAGVGFIYAVPIGLVDVAQGMPEHVRLDRWNDNPQVELTGPIVAAIGADLAQ